MNNNLLKNFLLYSRSAFCKTHYSKLPFLSSSSRGPRFFSTEDKPGESDSVQPEEKKASSVDDVVTEEELKRRIQKFYDGDVEAIPSIFAAILNRKLAGKNDEALIDQLPCRPEHDGDEYDDEDSDWENDKP